MPRHWRRRSSTSTTPRARADFDGARYQTADGGLALVPYGGSDLEASALAALVAPDRFDVGRLRAYLAARAGDDKETRERRNFALAGLAGLGASVLPEIRAAAADPALTVRERLLLGIGAAALGDAALAHSIAASLIETYGEAATGDQARLRVGSDAGDVTQATALMAILAAANGDPLAPWFWNYVEANPDEDATYALHAVGFVDRILAHAAPTTASFAYTTGGDRKVVELEPGEAFHVTILPSQLASFTVEPVSGSIAVTTSWREPVDADSFKKDPDIKVSRTVTPTGVAKSSDLVKVELVVDFGPLQPEGCVMVTDYVPSGLVAGREPAWLGRRGGRGGRGERHATVRADRPARLLLRGADPQRSPRHVALLRPGHQPRPVHLGDGDRAVAVPARERRPDGRDGHPDRLTDQGDGGLLGRVGSTGVGSARDRSRVRGRLDRRRLWRRFGWRRSRVRRRLGRRVRCRRRARLLAPEVFAQGQPARRGPWPPRTGRRSGSATVRTRST